MFFNLQFLVKAIPQKAWGLEFDFFCFSKLLPQSKQATQIFHLSNQLWSQEGFMRLHLKECHTRLLAAMWAACYFSLICQEVWVSKFCNTWRAQMPESCHVEERFPSSPSSLAGILVWRQMGRDGKMERHSSSGSLKAKTLVRLKEGRISNSFPHNSLREKLAFMSCPGQHFLDTAVPWWHLLSFLNTVPLPPAETSRFTVCTQWATIP